MFEFNSLFPVNPSLLQLPPDGTYPPRLLTIDHNAEDSYWSSCLWLYDGFALAGEEVTIHKNQHEYYITVRAGVLDIILINGFPIQDGHILQDGDFIYWADLSAGFIFQADPVKDRRETLTKCKSFNQTLPEPRKRVKKKIIIGDHGISLNGGVKTVEWEKIRYISLIKNGHDTYVSKHNIAIFAEDNGEARIYKSAVSGIWYKDMEALLTELMHKAPFNLTFQERNSTYWKKFPDAYHVAASEKISQNLPIPHDFIFKIIYTPVWKKRRFRERLETLRFRIFWFYLVPMLFITPIIFLALIGSEEKVSIEIIAESIFYGLVGVPMLYLTILALVFVMALPALLFAIAMRLGDIAWVFYRKLKEMVLGI